MYRHTELDDFPVTIPMSAGYVTYLGVAAKFACFSMFKYLIREAKDGIANDETCFITMSNQDWKFINCLSGWLNGSYRHFEDFADEFADQVDAPSVEDATDVLKALPYICEHISEYMMEVEKQYVERNHDGN